MLIKWEAKLVKLNGMRMSHLPLQLPHSALWCYKWMGLGIGWDGIWAGWGREHLDAKNIVKTPKVLSLIAGNNFSSRQTHTDHSNCAKVRWTTSYYKSIYHQHQHRHQHRCHQHHLHLCPPPWQARADSGRACERKRHCLAAARNVLAAEVCNVSYSLYSILYTNRYTMFNEHCTLKIVYFSLFVQNAVYVMHCLTLKKEN